MQKDFFWTPSLVVCSFVNLFGMREFTAYGSLRVLEPGLVEAVLI